jgi:L,D-transpeptidase ErfK/SrfK
MATPPSNNRRYSETTMAAIASTQKRACERRRHRASVVSASRSVESSACFMGGPPSCHQAGLWFARLSALVCLLSLTGCAGLLSPRPVLTDRFVLPSEETDVIGDLQIVYARYEDTLADFARDYGLGFDEIVAANPGVDPWLPGEGTKVILPTQYVLPEAPRNGLVLNLASLRLFYYPEPEADGEQVVITHPVGIGREGWRTPQGKFRITQKVENPVWRVPSSIRREHAAKGDPLPPIVPAGPDNPLGAYAMRLNRPQYLIHGTNKPYGVGMRVSHGCIRLYPEDIARLFPDVPVGTPVRIVNQPYIAGWLDGRLYLEAHKPLAEDAKRWKGSLKPMEKALQKKAADRPVTLNWGRARQVAQAHMGVPFSVSHGIDGVGKVLADAGQALDPPPLTDPQRDSNETEKSRSRP